MAKLDYSKKTYDARLAVVEREMQESDTRPDDLRHMADYLLFTNDRRTAIKERTAEYPIQSRNRDVTVEKRQTSLESIVEGLENSPISIYHLINSDRRLILENKELISEDAIARSPELAALYDVLLNLQRQLESSTSGSKYAIRKQIAETWQQMYLVRADQNTARVLSHAIDMTRMELPGETYFDDDDMPVSDCMVSFYNPTHVSFLLEYFTDIKMSCANDMNCDMYWLLVDFEGLVRDTFKHDPKMMRLMLLKMLRYTNDEIDAIFQEKYGETHSKQYYSTVWRHTIPRRIVAHAQERFVYWYWKTNRHLRWKKCIRCGQWKPAHSIFFRKNGSSNDKLYNKCRCCSRSVLLQNR